MKLILDIPENKLTLAKEFFNSISFIKSVKEVAANEVTNPSILKSIEDYEAKKVSPTPMSLAELKKLLNA